MTAMFKPPHAVREQGPHAVVIGAGLGGLAAAARLAAKGWRVTVVDKLDGPGGRAYVHRQDGFSFDAGPTIVTAPWILEDLWRDCGGTFADDVTLRANDPFYRIRFDDGRFLDYSADRDAMRAQIARFHPADADGYDRFLKKSGEIYKVAFEQLADKPFHSLLFTATTMADLVRLGGQWPVWNVVSRYFRDPRMRLAFSFHPLLIGGNPFSATSYYCLIAHLESRFGVHHAVGGTNAIVSGIVGLIEKNGGVLRYSSEVASIETEGGRATGVRLASGERIAADIVVSNGDPAWTYGKLLGHHRRKRWTDAKIERGSYSMSLFVWYFGTRKRYEDVLHHTMVLGPRYKGLLDDIFRKHKLAPDFSLYLHRPTASDPSLAPEGCDAFYVLSPVPHLKSGTDWESQAETYRLAIQKRLEETVMPGLGENLATSLVTTPLDFRNRLLSWNGAAFALEPKLLQSAWFRPHNRSEELPNLYLVGAGTHPGAGMPGVLTSAKILGDMVPDAAAFSRERAT